MITLNRDDFSEGFGGCVTGRLESANKKAYIADESPFYYHLAYFVEGKDLTFDGETLHESGKDTVRITNHHNLAKNNGYYLTVEDGTFISLSLVTHIPVFPTITVIDASNNPKIKDYFLKIDLICKQKKENWYLKASALFFTLLSELVETENSAGTPKRFKTLDKAVKYIHDHYLEPEFYCGCLPEISGIKYSYFNRLFAEKYRKPPSKYVTELRMERAAELLMSQRYTIEEVARKTGYNNPNYFSRIFKSHYGVAPSNYSLFTKTQTSTPILEHFNENDKKLCELLAYYEIMKGVNLNKISFADNIKTFSILSADAGAENPSIARFGGKFFVFWESCGAVYESHAHHMPDFSDARIIAQSTDPELIFCAPTCYVCNDRLYVTVSRKGREDKIYGLDLLIYNEDTLQFDFLKSLPHAFIPSSKACKGDGGVLMIPGRAAKSPEDKADIPAVLISYSGKFDGEWTLCYVQNDNRLPDGTFFDSPYCSICANGKTNYLLCRNSKLNVQIIYLAINCFDWWSQPNFHNIPFADSPICMGTLQSGRNFIIANIYPGTSKLAMFTSEPDRFVFTRAVTIQDGKSADLGAYHTSWHSPDAVEADGKLYVIYLASKPEDSSGTNLVVSEISVDF